ncbi:hypothetical protein Gohar_028425 [Gossypium harknessii]|uniref:MADS-box domain-containing protein n=1 Tax=Gossypium harknessii TaxID=34285 RepID=A0A7J9I5K8_9ROSI|nr:hypothetical protein [Gossypium harknessii]
MTRKKINLAYITNDSTTKAAYKKRKKVLMKKVSELSTLCEIDACAIMDIDMRINELSNTPHNPQSASSSLSSSVVTLAPMMMVMPEAMSRTSTEEIRQTKVDNMEMMNNNNPQTHVGGDKMML